MLKVTETIVKFKVGEVTTSDAWNELAADVVSNAESDATLIKEYLKPYEDEYMEAYHSDDPTAKKKNGTWKYSKYLPNAYNSAKSVICRAAARGIPIIIDKSIRGKSEVEKAIQSSKISGLIKTPEGRIVTLTMRIKSVVQQYPEIEPYAKDFIKKELLSGE